jgi:ornithine decarboxylase
MDYFRRFTFLFAAPVFDNDDLEGLRFNQIITEIERSGFEVVRARKLEDAEIAVQTDAAIGCMVVDWGKKGLEGKTAALINLMRRRGLDFPIILLIRRKRFEDLPVEVLDFIDGYVFLPEETPPFIAKNLISRLKQYAETLKTPFFGALVDYAEEGNQLWTPVRATMAACFTAAARSAGCSWNIWAKRYSATTSTIRCSTSVTF